MAWLELAVLALDAERPDDAGRWLEKISDWTKLREQNAESSAFQSFEAKIDLAFPK